jgi:hypothetical protein
MNIRDRFLWWRLNRGYPTFRVEYPVAYDARILTVHGRFLCTLHYCGYLKVRVLESDIEYTVHSESIRLDDTTYYLSFKSDREIFIALYHLLHPIVQEVARWVIQEEKKRMEGNASRVAESLKIALRE